MLEYTAVEFPVMIVDQKLDVKDDNYVPLNAQDRVNYELYQPSKYIDAPIGLQLVTRRFEDESAWQFWR
jgi:hypothetical protein